MIRIEDLVVKKGSKTIIEQINLKIESGKIYCIVGQNGAGKTTLLEALTGHNPFQVGNIIWDGISIKRFNDGELSRRRAVLSQNINLTFSVSVKELVEMGCYVSDEPLPKVKVDTLIQQALKQVEMGAYLNRTFNTLSGGEQKRVLLAKCIVQLNCCHWANINKYLFLDEPTSSLDIEQQYKLIDLIKKVVKRRNIGVIAILHDLNLAAQFADEIILLKSGSILKTGTPKEILTPAFIKETLNINTVVQEHPLLGCPHIIPVPSFMAAEKRTIQSI